MNEIIIPMPQTENDRQLSGLTRLPGYDNRTRRCEWAAFVGLGLTSAALISVAVSDAMKFAAERECIVAALSAPRNAFAQQTTNNQAHATLTNIFPQPSAGGGLMPAKTKLAAPQS